MKQSLTGFDWTESDWIQHLYWHTTRGMYNLFWVVSLVTSSVCYFMGKNGCHATSNSHLVKADQIYLSTDVDPLWADAENADAFEASLGIHNAGGHRGWQRRWHSDGDDVQGLNDDGLSWHLGQAEREKVCCICDNHLSLINPSLALSPLLKHSLRLRSSCWNPSFRVKYVPYQWYRKQLLFLLWLVM